MSSHLQLREPYGEGATWNSCLSTGLSADVKNVQNVYSPCMECTSIRAAQQQRSEFDKKYLAFYDKHANAFNTDLLTLRFAK